MSVEMLLERFDHILQTASNVEKLNTTILDLAIRGMLVPQDAEGETVNTLMEKIADQRLALIKSGKIRKAKKSHPILKEKMPFDLPPGWCWIRLRDLGITQTGTTPSTKLPEYYGNDYPFIKPADIKNSDINYDNAGLSKLGTENGRLIPPNSVLMVCIGGSIGKVGHVDRECSCNQQINVISPLGEVSSQFIADVMRSLYFQKEVFARAPQTTLPILSKGKWEKIPIPLPGSDEQKRIVTRVDELLSHTKELTNSLDAADTHRKKFHTAAIQRLTEAKTPKETGTAWHLIRDNFDLLYQEPETINELKQAILQLAAMGRLVPQDPNDEPAEVLLERIAKRRELWIYEEKRKGNREARLIERKLTKHDLSFPNDRPLPAGWQWTSTLQACCAVVDCHNKTAPYQSSGIPLIRTSNVRNGKLKLTDLKYVSQETYEYWSRRCPPEPGDVLFSREAPIGEAAMIPEGMRLCLGQRMMLMRPFHDLLDKEYLLIAVRSPRFLARLAGVSIGMGVKHLRVGAVERAVFPLPPHEEQQRIANRVHELLSEANELARSLEATNRTREQLLDALLAQAVS